MSELLDSEIKFLPGVGPKRAELLQAEAGIYTFRDLIWYFPYKYVDKTRFYKIRELDTDMQYVQIRGKISRFSAEGGGRGKRLTADFYDATGVVKLVWFKGHKWVINTYKPEKEYIIFGKPTLFSGAFNIVHPEIEEVEKRETRIASALEAQYSTTEKMKDHFLHSKAVARLLATVFTMPGLRFPESLPPSVTSPMKLMSLADALYHIHFPDSNADIEKARFRLKFEELFYIQLNLLRYKGNRAKSTHGFLFSVVGERLNSFYANNLPFALTEAQKRVIREIRADLGSGRQMNRLLQGDVGSGKTMVALMSMLIGADNGYQSCLMAPTEVLAIQHYNSVSRFVEGIDASVALLTGSTKRSERARIEKGLLDGSIDILIGTHALIEENVRYSNLGLVIIDEQHRFGVAQRAKLWQKSDCPPHVLVMTATPIPRTLAMTLYGDLDVSVIDEMPPGRKPIKTMAFTDAEREKVFGFMRRQIEDGRQIYVVYPLIKESESLDYKDLEDGLESIARAFPAPEYCISVVHGRMTTKDKEISMNLFRRGQAHIMVATTVIEVGVDVSNASVMVIESAERFGLSQLHQLRGRVGRGADQSYCILMTSHKLSADATERINTMIATNDGFEIAEADLRMRGPGDLEGTQQSGIPFDLKIADLGKDGQILNLARSRAAEILADDPELARPENAILKVGLRRLFGKKFTWSEIS
ncbi:MAG: ATP-dependent DNA helicase RecG [Bacteroidales bacterium]|jgi:ATP-dependent DNA helicase RecG|nr:ATP-dependent DNA helicase RecG [Bacteroidales bacterium]HOO67296.1 ATP-dependent DNA helicase RecG [Bacteroidales bacterium]HPJ05715.1 ATP-dependent DNA helicase RecG [Bacteroidales bacterium]HPQ64365.1 ATP-dependent DNA helicase RecG [Bacteroidales bacterium]